MLSDKKNINIAVITVAKKKESKTNAHGKYVRVRIFVIKQHMRSE